MENEAGKKERHEPENEERKKRERDELKSMKIESRKKRRTESGRIFSLEINKLPDPDYIMKIQGEIDTETRAIIVEWLIKITQDLNCVPETLYLTISYLDRYLTLNDVKMDDLMLLGYTCMIIAYKYEQNRPHRIRKGCRVVKGFSLSLNEECTVKEISEMEILVLKSLNFDMGYPTTYTFMRKLTIEIRPNPKNSNLKFKFLCEYLGKLCLMDYDCLRYSPSVLAASIVFLSNLTLSQSINPWTEELQEKSGYESWELKECVLSIQELQLGKGFRDCDQVKIRYQNLEFKRVSTLQSPKEIPVQYFEEDDSP